MRHADAGYEVAIDCAREQGLNLPMVGLSDALRARAAVIARGELRCDLRRERAAASSSTRHRRLVRAIAASAASGRAIVASGRRSTASTPASASSPRRASPTTGSAELQLNLMLSHAAGSASRSPRRVVRLVLALKAAGLARGYSRRAPRSSIERCSRCSTPASCRSSRARARSAPRATWRRWRI